MRALIQRVTEASVEVAGQPTACIGKGLLILICAMADDDYGHVAPLARKIANLRIFADDEGKMNLSIQSVGGAALIVSQFTLAADTSRGNRPGFSRAAAPMIGRTLYEGFVAEMRNYCEVQTGSFGAEMAVRLTNDGPATFWLEM
ncbi:MAG: D-aminoacyl-tRNA deacylase [Rhodobacteraceae bacterium]|nr:D-aminoacyl-tRNA deacylase [Paracoccaceae bacterium]